MDSDGVYIDTLLSLSGCDSLVFLDLSVKEGAIEDFEVFICEGDSFAFGGQMLGLPGIYRDTISGPTTCDSILILELFVKPSFDITIDTTISQGDTIFFGGVPKTQSGIFTDSLFTQFGCDSVVTLELQVISSNTLAAPSNLTVDNGKALLAKLNWKDNSSNEDGFRIIRDGVVIDVVGPNVTTYEDVVQVFGRTITYEVEAFNSVRTSARSNAVTYSMPRRFRRLELTYDCYNPVTDSLTWKVFNPNTQAHPYIFAQWWSSQRDTLFAPPGFSSFQTKNNPQNPLTFGDDNITGIWWVDQRLRPGRPRDIVFKINLGIDCRFRRTGKGQDPEDARIVFGGALKIDVSFEDADLYNDILAADLTPLPNPFVERLTLRMQTLRGKSIVRILSLTGQEVRREEVEFAEETKLDLGELARGMYLMEVHIDQAVHTFKVVKN